MELKDLLLSKDVENIRLASLLHYEGDLRELIKTIIGSYKNYYMQALQSNWIQDGIWQMALFKLRNITNQKVITANELNELQFDHDRERQLLININKDISNIKLCFKTIIELFPDYLPPNINKDLNPFKFYKL